MSGIQKIKQNRQQDFQSFGMELWLKDGDKAYVAFLASGKEDDARLDDYYRHSIELVDANGTRRWDNYICQKKAGQECRHCSNDHKPQHRFGLWVYVYHIVHAEKRNDTWTEVKLKTGGVEYKEDVNDFRIFSQGFGQKDYIWNQVVDIYQEHGTDKIVRVRRTGNEMKNTSYAIQAQQTADVKLNKEMMLKAQQLPGISEYYLKQEEANKPVSIQSESKAEPEFQFNTDEVLTESLSPNADDLF